MDIEESKKLITKNIKWSTKRQAPYGGQSCGVPNSPVVLTSEELDFEITIGFHRSQLKNRDLAFTLFKLALDELVK